MNKKAVFFSTDALVALIVILLSILVIFPAIRYSKYESEVQGDVLKVLSTLKIGEVDDPYAESLRAGGNITDLNKTILEQIGEFYVIDKPKAIALSQAMLGYLNVKDNIGIWINDELLAFKGSPYNQATAKNVEADRQFVSGLRNPSTAGEATGYFATASLSSASQKKYFYFGGYIGDGNISVIVPYGEAPESATLEVAANTDFNIWVNGNKLAGQFQAAESEFTPVKFALDAYIDSYFNQETNTVKFTAVDETKKLYFAGGYLRVTYKNTAVFSSGQKYTFPGIEGVINIYDSLYIPGNLDEMSVNLHYKSPYDIFLDIGGVVVYTGKSEAGTTASVSNNELQSKFQAAGLSYAALQRKTVPIRLGLYALYEAAGGNADVILITDLSDSMNWKMNSERAGTERACGDLSNPANPIYSPDTKRLSLAKCLDKMFADIILNSTGNRMGLVGFYGDDASPNKGRVYDEDLTKNSALLKSSIDAYSAQGGTPICAAINDAYRILNEQSSPERKKFIIVMSDGVPTHTCGSMSGAGTTCDGTRDGTHSNEALWLGNGQPMGARCYGGFDDCEVADCECASQNSIWSSCRARNNLNSTVYSIGFGPVASCSMANKTLRNIAGCGGGEYYASDSPEKLKDFYEQIAEEIIALSFIDQMSKVVGSFGNTVLYPDSSISLNYTPDAVPHGLIMTFETEEFGNKLTDGSFYVPEGEDIIEANVVSYSGPRWTDKVYVKNASWREVFSLDDYGNEYIKLGDAYVVNLPLNKLKAGLNEVKITTGSASGASGEASASDKAVYTLASDTPTSSGISAFSEGCIWNLEFYDSTTSTIKVPADYSGTDQCYYTSSSRTMANEGDALQAAVFNLLKKLDIIAAGGDGKIDIKFTEQDMQIDTSEIVGIPYTWSTEVQVRRWD